MQFSDGKLHIVFCDVGQGDAILIRTPQGKDILIDGGPDSAVLSCLSRYMPFWDRDIELVLVSHPQLDHFGGLADVVKHYDVKLFVEPGADGTAESWKYLKKALASEQAKIHRVQKGMVLHIEDMQFSVLNPYDARLQSTEDINNASIVGVLSYKAFDVLFTGDILPEGIATFDENIPAVEVLKVPHHGSKNGLTKAMLTAADPQLAVISSGKKNKFGHPHTQALALLKETKTLRTDTEGDIEIISDGKSWRVKR